MKSAEKARNNGLYRHIRTSKEIIRNLLNDFLKILIGVQYEIENVTIQQNPVLKKRRIFCINVTSSQKNALSCGMIQPQSRKRWRT